MPSSKPYEVVIYPPYTFHKYSLLSTLLLILILTGCGAPEEPAAPTATPLPPVLTMLVNAQEALEGDAVLVALEDEIMRRSNIRIDVQVVERHADALRALCRVNDIPVAAWLDGMTAAAAMAQNCGTPYLQVAREVVLVDDEAAAPTAEPTPESIATEAITATVEAVATDEVVTLPENGLTGQSGAIIVNRELGTNDLAVVVDRVYCRVGVTDFYSWLLPTLMFNTVGVDLTAGEVMIVEYDDTGALIEAVESGECAAAGVPQSAVDAGLPDNVQVAQTSVSFPFSVLIYPPQLDSNTRESVNDALLAIASDPQAASLLTPLLGQSALLPTSGDDFSVVNDFIASTGLDLAQLGQ